MDQNIADLLGIDPADPEVQREQAAVARDMDLIKALVEIRRKRGLTQQQVAERMGCSQPGVSDFERLGGDPHLSTIRRYALAVGVRVEHTVSNEAALPKAAEAAPRVGGSLVWVRRHLSATQPHQAKDNRAPIPQPLGRGWSTGRRVQV
ncbi:helix-turn-helix domain-containing protein [Nocardiopsis sp. LOL_012]|uniref:helix-turn-helix domain-containing protein n=1 Tax=Nocardiopsis sp. LOL_012 TaxID=3345409 RepID=UPI003A87E217